MDGQSPSHENCANKLQAAEATSKINLHLDRKYKLLMWFLPMSMEFVGLAKLGYVTSPVGIISPWALTILVRCLNNRGPSLQGW